MSAGLSLTLLPLKQNQVQRMLSAATWGSSFSTTSHLFFFALISYQLCKQLQRGAKQSARSVYMMLYV